MRQKAFEMTMLRLDGFTPRQIAKWYGCNIHNVYSTTQRAGPKVARILEPLLLPVPDVNELERKRKWEQGRKDMQARAMCVCGHHRSIHVADGSWCRTYSDHAGSPCLCKGFEWRGDYAPAPRSNGAAMSDEQLLDALDELVDQGGVVRT